ncbi:MAG: Smr/MutS family protein [Firmicutes bacterium]|nr:Smr/MutS family protein [Bacillota bacterium]
MTSGIVEVDLHGKNRAQAKISVDIALHRAKGDTYRIRVIHGHNSGTVLKEMLKAEYAKHPKILRMLPINASITDLVLREL